MITLVIDEKQSDKKIEAFLDKSYKIVDTNNKQKMGKAIIMYPELKLHPLKQKEKAKEIMDMYFNCLEQGNLLVYTNSSHIVNMFCYFVFKKLIQAEDIEIQYNFENGEKKIIKISDEGNFVDKKGKPIQFPEGFFDATLKEIFEINRY